MAFTLKFGERPCQCEHPTHIDNGGLQYGGGHPYGLGVASEAVMTLHGTFHLCGACIQANHQKES